MRGRLGLSLLGSLLIPMVCLLSAPVSAAPSHGLKDHIARLQRPLLTHQPAVEMSDLIVDLMPKSGTRFDWEPELLSSVIWLSDKPGRPQQGDYMRQALARIHTHGTAPVALRRRRREAGWTLKLMTDQAMALGPRWIEISPGMPGKGCFGIFYSGCLFTAEQVFASAPLNPRLQCRVGDMFSFNQIYRVSSPGRTDVLVVYNYTNADEDELSWVEIHKVSDLNNFCKKS
jgi:hypothetical protein